MSKVHHTKIAEDRALRALAQVTDYMDPVPHLPPSWLMGYRHAGPEAESYGELVLDFRPVFLYFCVYTF